MYLRRCCCWILILSLNQFVSHIHLNLQTNAISNYKTNKQTNSGKARFNPVGKNFDTDDVNDYDDVDDDDGDVLPHERHDEDYFHNDSVDGDDDDYYDDRGMLTNLFLYMCFYPHIEEMILWWIYKQKYTHVLFTLLHT